MFKFAKKEEWGDEEVDKIDELIKAQSDAKFLEIAASFIDRGLPEEEAGDVQDYMRAFDTTYEALKEEVSRLKDMGYTKAIFQNVNTTDSRVDLEADLLKHGLNMDLR